MPTFKTTWQFTQCEHARNEVLYWSNAAGSGNDCINDIITLATKRLALLARNWNIDAVAMASVTDALSPRTGATRLLYEEVRAPGPGQYNSDSYCPDTALHIRMADATFRWHRNYDLIGVPGSVLGSTKCINPGFVKMPDDFTTRLNAWLTELGVPNPKVPVPPAKSWAILARAAEGPVPIPRFPILGATADPGTGQWTISVAGPITPNIGTKIHVHNMRGCVFAGLNGDTLIEEVTQVAGPPAITELLLKKRQCCVGPTTGTAYNKRGTYYFPVQRGLRIADAIVERIVTRKNGTAGHWAAGKRKNQACCVSP